jgi:hypothetical protein
MSLILAFGNKARHGKDTAVAAIIDFYAAKRQTMAKHGLYSNVQTLKVNFADALRKEVTKAIAGAGTIEKLLASGPEPGMNFPAWVVPDPSPDMTDPLLPHGKHPKLLQWWGTEYRRNQDADYWVNKWKQAIAGFNGIVLTGDCRFLNEAKAVKSSGGFAVNIQRINSDGTAFAAPDRPADHPSEKELDGYGWDFYIKTVTGHAALTGEQAVTLAEYLLTLKEST